MIQLNLKKSRNHLLLHPRKLKGCAVAQKLLEVP
jgi:hypothetical protein